MSDSFADLWNSTAPSQPQKTTPLSQQKSTASHTQPKPKHDVFALLSQSSATTNRPNLVASRPGSSLNSSSTGSRPLTPSLSSGSTSRPGSSLASKPIPASSSSNDAFNNLFSGSFCSSTSGRSPSNLTMAERAAMVEKQRLTLNPQSRGQPASSESHQWAGLDALGAGSTSTQSTSSAHVAIDDWGLEDFGPPATAKPRKQAPTHLPTADLFDLGHFDSSSTAKFASPRASIPHKSKSSSLWDLDDFASASSTAPKAKPTSETKKPDNFDSPDFDFDFGNREDKDPSPHTKHEEDDILGMLSKPVESIRPQTNGSRTATTASSSSRRPPRSSSPPPHILGQIVEMGFSVQQAKSALAKTESGLDVQAALEMLLGDDNQVTPTPPTREPPPSRRPLQERYDNSDSDDEARSAASGKRNSQVQRGSPGDGSSTPNLQDQADKILAQASEIGLSVLTKASLFWKDSKEKVQKVYEERSTSAAGSSDRLPRSNIPRDTRPKWMQDAASSEDDPTTPNHLRGAFRDDHDDEEVGRAFQDQGGHRPEPSRPQRGVPGPSRQPVQPQPDVDLFSASASSEPSEPNAYVSPFRRKKPTADPAPSSSAPANPVRTAPRGPPAQPKPTRRLPFCPDTTLNVVRQHKTKGTEGFKLGQYSVAAEEYSKSLAMLPARHFLLIPLYTNRALARIRCGECKDAVEDASEALDIIGNGAGAGVGKSSWETWQPSQEDGGWVLEGGGNGEARGGYGVQREKGAEWNDVWGRGVDLRDNWIKAVRRRAEALEGLEKWAEARKDWEVLTSGGWVDGKTREEAVRGLGRCKKMIIGEGGSGDGVSSAPAPPKVKPRAKPTPAPTASRGAPSVAVKAYRAQVSAMEAEDALKHQLKDAVELRLLAWKKGKETNLRALLASLDLVLWDELIKDMGGKPGLADLVSGGGVKKWYMKSVSRVHPDKLNANNSTVEQRMIAGGVFGMLNEAWLAFKQ